MPAMTIRMTATTTLRNVRTLPSVLMSMPYPVAARPAGPPLPATRLHYLLILTDAPNVDKRIQHPGRRFLPLSAPKLPQPARQSPARSGYQAIPGATLIENAEFARHRLKTDGRIAATGKSREFSVFGLPTA